MRRLFGDGEAAGLVAEVRVAFLQIKRERIMERAADLIGLEVFFELITLGMAHDVKVINALGISSLVRELQRCAREEFVVTVGDAAAFAGPGIKVL